MVPNYFKKRILYRDWLKDALVKYTAPGNTYCSELPESFKKIPPQRRDGMIMWKYGFGSKLRERTTKRYRPAAPSAWKSLQTKQRQTEMDQV
jgi:hypothetical protein